MTRHAHQRLLVVLVTVLLVGTTVAPPALAQTDSDTDDGPISDIFGTAESVVSDGPRDAISSALAGAQGVFDRTTARLTQSDTPAATCAESIRTEVTDHNASYAGYLNNHTNATTARDVVAITCHSDPFIGDATTETVYIVADVNGTDYEHVRAVTETNRTVDEHLYLTGSATTTMPAEMDTFRTEYVANGTTPDAEYRRYAISKFAGTVYGTPEALPAWEEGDDAEA
jgi:hypothetical protein